jgi:transcriptional regulator with XRE-family HTH domain
VGNMAARFANGMDMAALGERIRLERQRRKLSLEVLAAQAGVSHSMLSDVERGEKVPSVLVLDRIATGLGTSIARLLGEERSSAVIVLRCDEQDVAVDLAGWERRILSPVLPAVEFEFMRTTLNPGIDAGVFSPHAPGSLEWVALGGGTLCLTIHGTPYTLHAGDSIYYDGDCWHGFVNPGGRAVRVLPSHGRYRTSSQDASVPPASEGGQACVNIQPWSLPRRPGAAGSGPRTTSAAWATWWWNSSPST